MRFEKEKDPMSKRYLSPGESVEGHTALKIVQAGIVQDTHNKVFYRVTSDGEVVTVHGDLEHAQAAEQQVEEWASKQP